MVQPVRTPSVPGKCMTLGSVLISWSCSLTHSPLVTMEPQQTHNDREVVNQRWDIERGSKLGGAVRGSRRDCGQVAVTAWVVYS